MNPSVERYFLIQSKSLLSVEAHVVSSGPRQQEKALTEEGMSLPSPQLPRPNLCVLSSFGGPSLDSHGCSAAFKASGLAEVDPQINVNRKSPVDLHGHPLLLYPTYALTFFSADAVSDLWI